jgi:Skp family chaperone for outer membrane proteins
MRLSKVTRICTIKENVESMKIPAKKISRKISTGLVAAAAVMALFACQGGKTVYVDNSTMFAQAKVFITLRDSVQAFNESWRKPAEILKDSVDAYMKYLSGLKSPVSDAEKAKMEKEFRTRQEALQTFVNANQKKATDLEKSLSESAFKKINALLQQYCDSKGYAMILGTTAGGNVLAADRKLDVTADVVTYLNAGSK